MKRHILPYVGLIFVGLLAFPLVTLAGGWAVVTLDALPVEPRAGQTLKLGFMVRQHGVTPIDKAFDMEPMIPHLEATNTDTGESLIVDGYKEGPLGHFAVEVTFPSAGVWTWQITPEPFQSTQLGRLSVLPSIATTQPATDTKPMTNPTLTWLVSLRWIGVGMLLAAATLVFTAPRSTSSRRRATASSES